MGEIWAAAAVVGSAVIGGVASNQASQRAAGASNAATRTATQETARQYDTTRADFAPQRSLGTSSTDALARLYGFTQPSKAADIDAQNQGRLVGDTYLPQGTEIKNYNGRDGEVWLGDKRLGRLTSGGPGGRFINESGVDPSALVRQAQIQPTTATGATSGAPDMGGFFESPDYQYNLDQSEKAIARAQASRSGFNSGRAGLELTRNASGLASGEFANYTNRLLAMAGLGQAATSGTAAAGAQAAGANSQAYLLNGQNQANISMQNGANINNSAQSGISNLLLQRYLAPSGSGNSGYPGPYGGH